MGSKQPWLAVGGGSVLTQRCVRQTAGLQSMFSTKEGGTRVRSHEQHVGNWIAVRRRIVIVRICRVFYAHDPRRRAGIPTPWRWIGGRITEPAADGRGEGSGPKRAGGGWTWARGRGAPGDGGG